MTVIQMSERELTRLRVLIDLSDKRLTVEAAATLMGLGRRQVYRLRCAFAFDGPAALVSRKRGRASNHRHGDTFRRAVLALVRAHYPDFGPTLAAEKLAARHGLRLGVETLRRWMIVEGIWKDRRHRLPSPHQPRRRRDCLGELVQIDGSEHAWFEDRGGMCTLLAFVDDATSRLMALRFVASESTFDYFRTTRAYLEAHGKPVAFYSDKHNIFRVNNGEGGDRVTQFGRALESLNIDIICANTPQAKGRVERAFGTLQDRLVKELRLAEIATIEAANAWLPGFVANYNGRFGRQPANAKDLHRPLTAADDLDEILAWREERTVTQNLTLHYDRMMLLLDPTPLARGLVHQEGRGGELPGRALRGSVQRNDARLQTVRQDPDSATRRDRRQQAAVGGVGAGEGAASRLSGASAARARCAAAPAEQPRGAWTAVEGAGTTPRCCCGSGLTSLVFRYVTENRHAKWPQIRRRPAIEQCRAPGSLSFASSGGATGCSSPQTSGCRPAQPPKALARCRRRACSRCRPSTPPGSKRCPTRFQGYGDGGRPEQAIVELDLETLAAIEPPQGYGRD